MTGSELLAAIDTIGWSARTLASRCDVRQTTVQRWSHDQQRIPPPVAKWLHLLAAFHRSHPAPIAPD
jgi:hypothetical protein